MNRNLKTFVHFKLHSTSRLLLLIMLVVFLMFMQWHPIMAQESEVTFFIAPTVPEPIRESTTDTEIGIDAVSNLFSVGFRLKFDPTFLEVVDSDPSTSDKVEIAIGKLFDSQNYVVNQNQVDNQTGIVTFSITLQDSALSINNPGSLAVITWRTKGPSQSELVFDQTTLIDSSGNSVPHKAEDTSLRFISVPNGTVSLQGRSNYGGTRVYLTDQSCSESTNFTGDSLIVAVTNQQGVLVDPSLKEGDTSITTLFPELTIHELDMNRPRAERKIASGLLTDPFDILHLEPRILPQTAVFLRINSGFWWLSAIKPTFKLKTLSESNPANQCLWVFRHGYLVGRSDTVGLKDLGTITLLAGDVTSDGINETGDNIINIFDLTFISKRYDTTDAMADLNGDGLVDIFDLVIVAGNYNQKGPVTNWSRN